MQINTRNYAQYIHRYEAVRVPNKETASTQNPAMQPQQDSFELTEESKKQWLKDRQAFIEKLQYDRMAEAERENKEKQDEAIKEEQKIMLIFRRLFKGDTVPPTDERKLMEYNEDMYKAAKMAQLMAQLNDRREKEDHDSLWKEEDENAATGADSPSAAEEADARNQQMLEFGQAQKSAIEYQEAEIKNDLAI